MTEGRTSAAQANVDAEGRSIDAPTSTGAAGAGDVSGTDGHDGADETTSGSGKSADATTGTDATTETVPAATLPGEGSASAPAHGGAADDKAATSEPATDEAATDEVRTTDATADESTTAKTTETPTAGATTAGDATAHAGGNGDEEWADEEDKAYKRELRKGFAFGAAGGILIGAIVALLLGAFIWPGYLLGPGSPDDTANQVTTALAAKDGPTLDRLSCKGPDGQPVSQLSGQVLQYIQKVTPAGPTTTLIDTEARSPIDVTLSVQGQTQTLPSELVLGESKGDWCLKGLAQRQQ